MPDRDPLEERLRAVERALTDGDDLGLAALGDAAALAARVEDAEERLDDLDDRVAELEAATQALRGYVGNVRHVNRSVEERADAALARVERLESELDDRPPSARHASQPPAGRTGQPPVVGASATDADALPGDPPETATGEAGGEADGDDGESGGLLVVLERWL